MNNLAIIPARGASKRIPHKNIRPFLGKPLIQYSIDTALKSGCFSEVMVSTDDEKIAKIARRLGAKVPFLRSKKNSGDKATLSEALIEVIERYQEAGQNFDYVCCIFATAALLEAKTLQKALKMLKKSGGDSLIPVIKYSHPIQRAFKISDGRLSMIEGKNMFKNTQEFMPTYHDAGQFYWFKTDNFLKRKKLFTNNSIALELPEMRAQDIDHEEDLKIAELKYKILFDL